MYLLGFDIGSSSIKAALVEAANGKCVAQTFYPKSEAPIAAPRQGWAEQHPADWWKNLKLATHDVMQTSGISPEEVGAIGISYQMHGLVCVDKDQQVLRPAIIWCDSRAVSLGERAFNSLGEDYCLRNLLNSPGNFTAAKLAWIKENEPEVFDRIDKVMLPGDYIAMKLTGEARTTLSGLSEGIFWDFRKNSVSEPLLLHFGIPQNILPDRVPTFGFQGETTESAAAELGLRKGIPVTYRAGDQPNNALSLNVFNPGEIASTAGTSGVVYGVIGQVNHDPQSRVNTFAHVNHTATDPRLGVLLCINGTGCLNSWVRRTIAPEGIDYATMNRVAATAPIGSSGISFLPFGNGAERMLCNAEPGASLHGVNFNVHDRSHLMRAAQEGIVFAFMHGIRIMEDMGLCVSRIHAGHANLFLSPLFRQTLANVSGAVIELYDTDGAVGAAKGAGIGAGIYRDSHEAFESLTRLEVIEPIAADVEATHEAYARWEGHLKHCMH